MSRAPIQETAKSTQNSWRLGVDEERIRAGWVLMAVSYQAGRKLRRQELQLRFDGLS